MKNILETITKLINDTKKEKEELNNFKNKIEEMNNNFSVKTRINPSLVTTSKIVEGSVTTAKLVDVHPLGDPALVARTLAKEKEEILVTREKMENENLDKLIDNFLNS